MRIGVDSGGTFTDCVVFTGSQIKIVKIFSSRQQPAQSTVTGVQNIAGNTPISAIVHGTTVGTNALLERSGARVVLITTSGFEDLIEIGRQNRERLYDLNPRRDPVLVGRALRWGVNERIAPDGSVLLAPHSKELRTLALRLRASGAEAVSICLLFSYANPSNEQALARALRGVGLPLSVSHEILPEFREYERISTTVINAYLMPSVGGYLKELRERTAALFAPNPSGRRRRKSSARSSQSRLYIMQSNGGITTAARAVREPVRTSLSGPA